MKLFILRHGDAEHHARSDQMRALTPRGRNEVQQVVSSVADELQNVEMMLVSPYVRAQQTADIAVAYTPSALRVETRNLVPEAEPLELFNQLSEHVDKTILLVSHQPLVGTLVNQLSGKPAWHFNMGTANLACFECELPAAGCCDLLWIKRPE